MGEYKGVTDEREEEKRIEEREGEGRRGEEGRDPHPFFCFLQPFFPIPLIWSCCLQHSDPPSCLYANVDSRNCPPPWFSLKVGSIFFHVTINHILSHAFPQSITLLFRKAISSSLRAVKTARSHCHVLLPNRPPSMRSAREGMLRSQVQHYRGYRGN